MMKSKLEEKICFILYKAGVSAPEVDDCMEWAFGKGAWYIPPWPDWAQRWNKKHGRLFIAKRNDNFVEFMYCIGFFYVKQRYEKSLKISQN